MSWFMVVGILPTAFEDDEETVRKYEENEKDVHYNPSC